MCLPIFDTDDRTWAEGELDGVEARDPELRVSKRSREGEPSVSQLAQEPHRHSARFPESSRLSASQPALRRSASQAEHTKRKEDSRLKNIYTRERGPHGTPRGKFSDRLEEEQPTQLTTRRGSQRSGRKRLILDDEEEQQHRVGSDDSTQAPSDDDGAAAGAAGATTGVGGFTVPSFSLGIGLMTEGEESQRRGGESQGQGEQRGGYEGQQREAMLDWGPGYGSTYAPHFQPSYSDVSSIAEGGHSPGYGTYYGYAPAQSEGTSSQQPSTSPRVLQRGFEDMAASLFGYGYGQYMQSEFGYGQPHEDEDESSSTSYPYR